MVSLVLALVSLILALVSLVLALVSRVLAVIPVALAMAVARPQVAWYAHIHTHVSPKAINRKVPILSLGQEFLICWGPSLGSISYVLLIRLAKSCEFSEFV